MVNSPVVNSPVVFNTRLDGYYQSEHCRAAKEGCKLEMAEYLQGSFCYTFFYYKYTLNLGYHSTEHYAYNTTYNIYYNFRLAYLLVC